jgi:hypothetical protein
MTHRWMTDRWMTNRQTRDRWILEDNRIRTDGAVALLGTNSAAAPHIDLKDNPVEAPMATYPILLRFPRD